MREAEIGDETQSRRLNIDLLEDAPHRPWERAYLENRRKPNSNKFLVGNRHGFNSNQFQSPENRSPVNLSTRIVSSLSQEILYLSPLREMILNKVMPSP